jgi:hypothetical protein
VEFVPTGFEVVMQSALNILREYAEQAGENKTGYSIVSLQPAKVLHAHGLTHTDAERAYSGLKRIGLVEVLRRGRGNVEPVIRIELSTSVVQRRLEQKASHQRGRVVIGQAALLAYYNQQEADLRIKLDQVLTAKAKLVAQMESESSLQPT